MITKFQVMRCEPTADEKRSFDTKVGEPFLMLVEAEQKIYDLLQDPDDIRSVPHWYEIRKQYHHDSFRLN